MRHFKSVKFYKIIWFKFPLHFPEKYFAQFYSWYFENNDYEYFAKFRWNVVLRTYYCTTLLRGCKHWPRVERPREEFLMWLYLICHDVTAHSRIVLLYDTCLWPFWSSEICFPTIILWNNRFWNFEWLKSCDLLKRYYFWKWLIPTPHVSKFHLLSYLTPFYPLISDTRRHSQIRGSLDEGSCSLFLLILRVLYVDGFKLWTWGLFPSDFRGYHILGFDVILVHE